MPALRDGKDDGAVRGEYKTTLTPPLGICSGRRLGAPRQAIAAEKHGPGKRPVRQEDPSAAD